MIVIWGKWQVEKIFCPESDLLLKKRHENCEKDV